jgi:hypothetical protein
MVGVGGTVLEVGETMGGSGSFGLYLGVVAVDVCVGVAESGDVMVVVLNNAGGDVTRGRIDCGPDDTDPFSRLTSFWGALFPEKNSPAVRAGSDDGAGG